MGHDWDTQVPAARRVASRYAVIALTLEVSMPRAVFDYDEIRKRVRTDYLFGREARRTTVPARATSSTVGTSAVPSCDWCGKGGSDAESCPHNRNTGGIWAIVSTPTGGHSRPDSPPVLLASAHVATHTSPPAP